jgi:hypothetical protein
VDVGAQVVGTVQAFGRDPRETARPVDYGTQVEEGTILARIDGAVYRGRTDKWAAHVAHTRAEIAKAEADQCRAEANTKRLEWGTVKLPKVDPDRTPCPYRVEVMAGDLGLILRRIDPAEVRRRPRYLRPPPT